MASVMIYENLVPTDEVVIRLTTDEAQELFEVLGDDGTNRSDDLYTALANEGFEHPNQNRSEDV